SCTYQANCFAPPRRLKLGSPPARSICATTPIPSRSAAVQTGPSVKVEQVIGPGKTWCVRKPCGNWPGLFAMSPGSKLNEYEGADVKAKMPPSVGSQTKSPPNLKPWLPRL